MKKNIIPQKSDILKISEKDNEKYWRIRNRLEKITNEVNRLREVINKTTQTHTYITGQLDLISEDIIESYGLDKTKQYDIQNDGTIKLI